MAKKFFARIELLLRLNGINRKFLRILETIRGFEKLLKNWRGYVKLSLQVLQCKIGKIKLKNGTVKLNTHFFIGYQENKLGVMNKYILFGISFN